MKNTNHFSDSPGELEGSNSVERKRREFLFRKCVFIVEAYVKSHVQNQDDVCNLRQEALLRIYEALFSSRYREKGRFIPWVMTITMNVVHDYYRRRQKAPKMLPLESESIVLPCVEEDNFRRYLLLEYYYEIEKKAISELSLYKQSLIVDILYEKMSFRKAAEKRGISKSSCFKLYQKILSELRKKFINDGIDLKSMDGDL